MIVAARGHLPAAVRRAIVTHARAARPLECCGFLLGWRGRVTASIAMANAAAASRTAFEIDPAAHIALRRMLRQMTPSLEIVGVYHSHPSGAAHPSPTDQARAWYPGWIYVIVGFERGRPRVGLFSVRRSQARASLRDRAAGGGGANP